LTVSKKAMAYFDEAKDQFVEEDITYIAYTGSSSAAKDLKTAEFRF
jgi:hypothetical protein